MYCRGHPFSHNIYTHIHMIHIYPPLKTHPSHFQTHFNMNLSRFFTFLLITLAHILSANCRHLAPTPVPTQHLTMPMALQLGGSVVESRIGSSPPSCEHKCFGCSPCEATQVPTSGGGGQVKVSIQDSNYEPEGWKCKCGPTFYSP